MKIKKNDKTYKILDITEFSFGYTLNNITRYLYGSGIPRKSYYHETEGMLRILLELGLIKKFTTMSGKKYIDGYFLTDDGYQLYRETE